MTFSHDPYATIDTQVSLARGYRRARPHYFQQIEGKGSPMEFQLDRQELIIGRGETADIRLLSRKASRHHALLRARGGEYTIRDYESRNGVFLNGIKIRSAVLRDGDVVQLADVVFVYHEG